MKSRLDEMGKPLAEYYSNEKLVGSLGELVLPIHAGFKSGPQRQDNPAASAGDRWWVAGDEWVHMRSWCGVVRVTAGVHSCSEQTAATEYTHCRAGHQLTRRIFRSVAGCVRSNAASVAPPQVNVPPIPHWEGWPSFDQECVMIHVVRLVALAIDGDFQRETAAIAVANGACRPTAFQSPATPPSSPAGWCR